LRITTSPRTALTVVVVSPMRMSVMDVRIVRMRVDEWLVAMRMTVRLAGRIVG
jgi:hypothetical protein